MKVYLVNSTKTWGGGEKWHLETACSLKKKGFEVAVLARRDKELYKRSLSSGLVTMAITITNLSFLNPFRLFSFYRLFRKEKPDAIILNFSADIKTAGTAARLAGIRNIIYRRGSAIPIRNTWLNRFLYGKIITHIIANSLETRDTILQKNPKLFPAGNITVIYNGIDLDQLDRMPVPKPYERRENEIVIGNAGRLVMQKGQKYLIEMAALMKRKGFAFTLLIAGDGPLEPSLKKMAADAGVEDRVVFLGFVENVKAFLQQIDIFVLPSLWEGFGYVLVEAMACRKPVVAFRTSSNPEIVAHGETGFLVPMDDIEEFSEKIIMLARHPEMRSEMGSNGRRRVEEVFNIQRSHERFVEFLNHLP